MIVAFAIVVAAACIAASTRRLWLVARPTALHPTDVLDALATLRGPMAITKLRRMVEREPTADWERDLLDALLSGPRTRSALVNEQLTELDHRIQRWQRVPRVSASIATSVGIMLGTLVLRDGLAAAPEMIDEAFVWSILNDAIAVVGFGVVGTAFCIAANVQARRMSRTRLEVSDRMIERLEVLAAADDPPGEAPFRAPATT